MGQVSPDVRAVVEAAYGALNRCDLDAFIALTTEDVEFTSLIAEAEGTTFRGHDGVRAWWAGVPGAFAAMRWELLDVKGAGDRGVTQIRVTGVFGGIRLEGTMWTAFRLRDGKFSSWATVRSEQEALAAAELKPSEPPNVEIARRAAEAASHRPRPDFETINALYHPDHEFLSALSEVEGQSFRGASGYREWLASIGDALDYKWTVEELFALDQQRVLVRYHLVGHGKGSGVPFDQDLWSVVTVQDGRVVRTEVHATREQALRAAGVNGGSDG